MMKHSDADPLSDEVTSGQPIAQPVLRHRDWNDEADRYFNVQLHGESVSDAFNSELAVALTRDFGQILRDDD